MIIQKNLTHDKLKDFFQTFNNSSSYILTPRVQYKNFSIKSCVITTEKSVISDKISLVCPQFSVNYNSGRSSFSFKDELERKFKIEESRKNER